MFEMLKRHWLLIGLGAIGVIFLFISKDRILGQDTTDLNQVTPVLGTIAEEQPEINKREEQSTSAIVDVKGEVNKPGVYDVDTNSRIHDVIELAEGFSNDADQLQINLAQKVHDEMTIIVPKIGEVINQIAASNDSGSDKISINTATQAEIETLSGIGPAKAQAIIQYRDDHGLFESADDLLEISGIGAKTLENIRDDIQVP